MLEDSLPALPLVSFSRGYPFSKQRSCSTLGIVVSIWVFGILCSSSIVFHTHPSPFPPAHAHNKQPSDASQIRPPPAWYSAGLHKSYHAISCIRFADRSFALPCTLCIVLCKQIPCGEKVGKTFICIVVERAISKCTP